MTCASCDRERYRYEWHCQGCRDRWIQTLLENPHNRVSGYLTLAMGFQASESIKQLARHMWQRETTEIKQRVAALRGQVAPALPAAGAPIPAAAHGAEYLSGAGSTAGPGT